MKLRARRGAFAAIASTVLGLFLLVSAPRASAVTNFEFFVEIGGATTATVMSGATVKVDLFMSVDTARNDVGQSVSVDIGPHAFVQGLNFPPPGTLSAGSLGSVGGSIYGPFASFGFVTPAGTHRIGEFDVVAQTTGTITPGFFFAGVDGLGPGDTVVHFSSATIFVVPEPGTALLVALGTGWIALTRRRFSPGASSAVGSAKPG